MNIQWFLFKMLFRKSGLSKAMVKFDEANLKQYKQEALNEENYELAALISYYLQFKFDKCGKRIHRPTSLASNTK